MSPILCFLIYTSTLHIANTQYAAEVTPEPNLCLKESSTILDTVTYVKCTPIQSYPNATYEYPQMEKLTSPKPRKCLERLINMKSPLGKNYYLSLFGSNSDLSWINARNFCREMCMDLVSLETTSENNWVKDILVKFGMPELWTSGRLCDFKGCEEYRSPHMWPIEENGWFWAGTGVRIPSYTDLVRTDWSLGGPLKNNRQPDNRAHRLTGKNEACIAIMNNLYNDGVHWHDELCEERKAFLCEDNEVMLEEAKKSPEYL